MAISAPAATDGGVTSGLQEDFLAHPTVAANKLLAIVDNAEYICSIELLAAAQAHDFLESRANRAKGTDVIHQFIRAQVPHYSDDRPLSADIERLRSSIQSADCPAVS
jgi:histidine ammonia-lyase